MFIFFLFFMPKPYPHTIPFDEIFCNVPNQCTAEKKSFNENIMNASYLVGTTSPSITNSQDVILIGHAMWPKLSRTRASHDEYGVCESLCSRSERCKRARLFGVVPPELGDVDGLKWSISKWKTLTTTL